MKRLEISFPGRGEQSAIVEVGGAVDTQIKAEAAKSEALTRGKTALSQALLTGSVCVAIEE